MQPVISVQTMRESDAYTIAHKIPSLTLMWHAAMGIFKAADWSRGKRIGIVIGSGNNGGDGSALACILAQHGIASTLYQLSGKLSPDNAYYLDQARELGVPVLDFAGHKQKLSACDIIVDCILGTGFQGAVRGVPREAIQSINQSGAYVISADINSGLNGDTGEGELAVISDLTVSIGFFKTGMFRGQASAYIRRLVNVDIGIRLLREEYTLCAPEEAQGENRIACPAYCALEKLVI